MRQLEKELATYRMGVDITNDLEDNQVSPQVYESEQVVLTDVEKYEANPCPLCGLYEIKVLPFLICTIITCNNCSYRKRIRK